ncbi:hypothetical protein [Bradyrhizobium sp. WD16]|uniref:hypothetical protein n=1 Tax=Bradyrhizobium sp. WD16 TaxID=1521768 RepID=UPI0020A41492|nr:hypothetical protein [Bradyrhizobium sp. WD16]
MLGQHDRGIDQQPRVDPRRVALRQLFEVDRDPGFAERCANRVRLRPRQSFSADRSDHRRPIELRCQRRREALDIDGCERSQIDDHADPRQASGGDFPPNLDGILGAQPIEAIDPPLIVALKRPAPAEFASDIFADQLALFASLRLQRAPDDREPLLMPLADPGQNRPPFAPVTASTKDTFRLR